MGERPITDRTRVLVTGGAGFLGSHLVELLRLERGLEPIVVRSRDTDLRDAAQTARLFSRVRPEVVFHLAASAGGIGANLRYPGRFWHDNLSMGANVLEQSRVHGVAKVVLAGTVCSYPKRTKAPFREEDLWLGYPEETNAPYGEAKRALLVGAQAYRAQYGLNAVMPLIANLYGPRDDFDLERGHVVAALVRKMLEARRDGRREIVLWGDGSPTREFLYVADCARGLLLMAERYDSPEPVNLGSGEEVQIGQLAELVAELTGFRGEIRWDSSLPNGQPRRTLDVSKAKEAFAFEAQTSLREGLERTIAWYRATL
jgi:GDP-L-fucose synthase